MSLTEKRRNATRKLVLGAMMTALVVLFQYLATYTTFFGPFSTAMALIPIAIGAALCGPAIGAWLGLVFAIVVFATGGADLFFAFSIPGTIIVVTAKGVACGFAAGITYKLLEKINLTVAAVACSLACPIVNTGVFLLGGAIFFMPYADAIAETLKMDVSGFALFLSLAGANFLFEVLMNLLLSPAIVRLMKFVLKDKK